MCDKIGKVRSDGSVLWIELTGDIDFDREKSTLMRFYTVEKRLDALLALGNIFILRPSPYVKYDKDKPLPEQVACVAEVRDCEESVRKHGAKTSASVEEFARRCGDAYLWKEGRWFYLTASECTLLAEKTITERKPEPDYGDISIKRLSAAGLKTDSGMKFQGFDAVQQKADMDGNIYFIFRDKKLIKTIRPKN